MPASDRAPVFDIKRFAVHDGSGLRTTVFFKGCPLRCRWCQNPEGLDRAVRPVYLKKQCIHCGLCARAARPGQLVWDKDHPRLNREQSDFDNLVEACPAGAIRADACWFTVDELVAEILADEVFFRRGGGVTFSGGEPFAQGQFLVDLLQACQARGLHTAIESSFYADTRLVRAASACLDQIYCDVKFVDPKLHKAFTGVDNATILDNVRWLLSDPGIRDKVCIRTPLVPGCSGTEKNVREISEFLYELYPGVHYELLNYNPLAPAKYEMTGREYELGRLQPFSKEEMDHFRDIVRQAGLTNVVEE